MPTFTYEQIAPGVYYVRDAHTREVYGKIKNRPSGWQAAHHAIHERRYPTRDDAARALYTARYAHGFEAGAL